MVHEPSRKTDPRSVRYYGLTPAGEPFRVTASGMALIHHEPCPVIISAFANQSIRFAELVLRMVDRKPAELERTGCSLIRFDAQGRPDMDRYRRETEASLRANQDALLDFIQEPSGKIVDMRDRFLGMGGRWTPTLQESMLLDQVALGRIKVKTLRFDDATFDLEDEPRGPEPDRSDAWILRDLPPPLRRGARLRAIHRQQPRATVTDVPMDRPVEVVVLAPKTTGALCRLLGREEVLTLRDARTKDRIPGQILTLRPDRVWSYQGNTFVSGETLATRLDAAALGLRPLALEAWGTWDPEEDDWREEGEPLESWARPIAARGPRPSFELESCHPGETPEDLDEDWDSDPIQEAIDDWNSGRKVQALRKLEALCQADLRCLDAHAHLGTFHFDRHPERALLHYQAGIAIGQLSLGPGFDGVLPWGCLGNRPYLRCLHGAGLCLWRLGFFQEAEAIFHGMLWLNPSDNQGARFILPVVRSGQDWRAFVDAEESGR